MGLPGIDVNLLAVLVAAIASIIIGSLWYSPLLFGNTWIKLMGFSKRDMEKAKQKGMAGSYFVTLIASIVMGYVMAYLIYFMSVAIVIDGIMLGVLAWLGFIVPLLIGNVLWDGKPMKLFFIHAFYWLVNVIVMSAILTAWK